MNKVLVTGLGLANEFGICEACNLNFSWLVHMPSTLLWADQLYIPQSAFDEVLEQSEEKDIKIIRMFLNMAESHGMIHRMRFSDAYQKQVGQEIYNKMLEDSQNLLQAFPEAIKKGNPDVPNEIVIGGEGYCGAWMSSIYAGIRAAKDLGANCLFSDREHNFLKYLYGLHVKWPGGSAVNRAYSEIFSLYMPEGLAAHTYAFSDENKCKECTHYTSCKDSYLSDTEQALEKMFQWREYDELQRAKEEIDEIISLKNEISSQKDIDDVVRSFRQRQEQINRNIHSRFPKIRRWTKMTTVLATPITISSAVFQNAPLTVGSAAATGIAQATEKLLEIYESKHNWVGFINGMKQGSV